MTLRKKNSIKNNKNLIETLKKELQVKESSMLISLDVVNMFTNIPVEKS